MDPEVKQLLSLCLTTVYTRNAKLRERKQEIEHSREEYNTPGISTWMTGDLQGHQEKMQKASTASNS